LLPVQNPPDRLQSSSSESLVAAEPAHPIRSPATMRAPRRPRRLRMIIRPLHHASIPARQHSCRRAARRPSGDGRRAGVQRPAQGQRSACHSPRD